MESIQQKVLLASRLYHLWIASECFDYSDCKYALSIVWSSQGWVEMKSNEWWTWEGVKGWANMEKKGEWRMCDSV